MKQKEQFHNYQALKILIVFLFVYGLFIVGRAFVSSVYLARPDRITIVFYGENPSFVSLGRADSVNYVGFFDHNVEVYIPGGYGRYKIGSLGELAAIEKNPEILQRAFSSILSAHVDFVFYPRQSSIFEPSSSDKKVLSGIPSLNFLDALASINYKTNASFFDRMYIFVTMLQKNRSDFSLIQTENIKKDTEGNAVFQEDRFDKRYQGYFYQSVFRDEGKTVQILYENYKSATVISRIIEGEGIHVVDLTKYKGTLPKTCIIRQSETKHSKTASFLASYFDCKVEKVASSEADIVIILGEKVEKNWE